MGKDRTLEIIKTEIDKRYAEYREKMKSDDFTYYEGMADALDLFEQFIDSLESEKPMNQEVLEEEIVKVCDDFVFPLYGLDDEFGRELINKIAHHFAQWGYLRAAEKYNEMEYNRQREEESVPNDLEEAKEAYCEEHNDDCFDATGDKCPHIRNAFIAGAKWDRQQMMKEAVEGTVHNFSSYKPHPTVLVDANGFNQGDKVRVIVCPKED